MRIRPLSLLHWRIISSIHSEEWCVHFHPKMWIFMPIHRFTSLDGFLLPTRSDFQPSALITDSSRPTLSCLVSFLMDEWDSNSHLWSYWPKPSPLDHYPSITWMVRFMAVLHSSSARCRLRAPSTLCVQYWTLCRALMSKQTLLLLRHIEISFGWARNFISHWKHSDHSLEPYLGQP